MLLGSCGYTTGIIVSVSLIVYYHTVLSICCFFKVLTASQLEERFSDLTALMKKDQKSEIQKRNEAIKEMENKFEILQKDLKKVREKSEKKIN